VGKLLAKLEKQFGPHRYGELTLDFSFGKTRDADDSEKKIAEEIVAFTVVRLENIDGVKFIAEILHG